MAKVQMDLNFRNYSIIIFDFLLLVDTVTSELNVVKFASSTNNAFRPEPFR